MTRREPASRPNILLIHADQHRWDCLGAYGHAQMLTPHLDSLALDGVRYDNCFCPYPVCTPSRYSLLSGLYVHEHRGATNRSTMLPGTETFPRILARAGYRTAAVGKMHFTPTYCDVGFQDMYLAEQDGEGRWDDDYHRWLRDKGLVDLNDLEDQRREYRQRARPAYWDTFGALPSNLPEEAHSTTWIGDRALEVLQRWEDGGNLLMVGFIKPHHPFDPPRSWDATYDHRYLPLLPGWTDSLPPQDAGFARGYFPNESLTPAALRRVMAGYYATISQIDRQVGRLLEHLKRRSLYDDTLVIYTSDHGDYMGFHHMILKGNHQYDPLARVPLIVKYPRNTRRGRSSPALVSLVDLAPTILLACGAEPADAMTGLNLGVDSPGRDVVFAESHGYRGGELMVRSVTHKLLYNRAAPGESLMFDLRADPYELHNVYADPSQARVREALEEAVLAWFPGDYEPYVDERAPRITGKNVPGLDDDHRAQMAEYCWRMVHGNVPMDRA